MSISRKLNIYLLFAMSAVLAVSAYVHYRLSAKEEIERLENIGDTAGHVVEAAIIETMRTKDKRLLSNTLKKLSEAESIFSIQIVDNNGVVRAANNTNHIGETIEIPRTVCPKCADKDRRCVHIEETGIFRWIQPVQNRPDCRGCHNMGQYNGAIVIDFSTRIVREQMQRHLFKEVSSFLLAFVVLSGAVVFLVRRLVIRRLKETVDTIKRLKDGDYAARFPATESNDEIGEINRALNSMADAVSARDTEKSHLIERISISKNEWQTTFDCITDLVSLHDLDNRVLKANRAFAAYFGLSPRDVIGRQCCELLCKACSALPECSHEVAIKEKSFKIEEFTATATGRLLKVSVYPYYDQAGKIKGTVHITKDVTEERQKEMRLITNERLAALGQMVSGIAHEINNPLSAIAGCAEGLLRRAEQGVFDPAIYNTYLKIIAQEVTRCKEISTGMLSFGRRTDTVRNDIDINRTLEKALDIFEMQGRLQAIEVIKKLDERIGQVHGNEGELRQAFIAIITNALDAMSDKGTLTIQTEKGHNNVVISISDTGPGIPPHYISRIFDPFFTTKSAMGGTGLGLSIAHRIITDHKGAIDVQSEKNRGARFIITLPL